MSGEQFKPVFGPNGAVMNSPSMTPEMRAKFGEIGRIPPRRVLLKFAFLTAAWGLLALFALPIRELATASPWWACALAGALAMLGTILILMRARLAVRAMSNVRARSLPLWLRVLLAASEMLFVAGHVVCAVLWFADIKRELYVLTAASLATAIFFGILTEVLRWQATRRGWMPSAVQL